MRCVWPFQVQIIALHLRLFELAVPFRQTTPAPIPTPSRSLKMRASWTLAIGLLAPVGIAWPLSFNGILKKRAAAFTPLRFTSDGNFQISVFNDLHYGEGE